MNGRKVNVPSVTADQCLPVNLPRKAKHHVPNSVLAVPLRENVEYAAQTGFPENPSEGGTRHLVTSGQLVVGIASDLHQVRLDRRLRQDHASCIAKVHVRSLSQSASGRRYTDERSTPGDGWPPPNPVRDRMRLRSLGTGGLGGGVALSWPYLMYPRGGPGAPGGGRAAALAGGHFRVRSRRLVPGVVPGRRERGWLGLLGSICPLQVSVVVALGLVARIDGVSRLDREASHWWRVR
jgi:hypothetical protein